MKREPSARMQFVRKLLAICRPLGPAIAIGLPLVIVNRLAGLALPASAKILVDDVLANRRDDILHRFLLITIGASIIQGATVFGLAWFVERAQERFMASLRARVQSHIMSLPLIFHEHHKTGALVSLIMNDVQGFARFFSTGLIDLGGALAGAVVAYALLAYIEPLLATAGLAVILLHTLLSQGSMRKAKTLHAEHSEARANVMGRLNESLSGVRVVKAYAVEPHENAVFEAGALRLMSTYLVALLATRRLRAASVVIAGAGTSLILCAGALRVGSGALTIGGLMAFSSIMFLLIAPISQLAAMAPQVSEALSGAERTLALLSTLPEGAVEERLVSLPRIAGRVAFENVTFAYVPGRPILRNISFTAEPNTVTAFVGRSGAGKSTIAALLASLYTPLTGSVVVDGHDLRSLVFDSYRGQLGMVLQDTFLFDGTILDNVAFSRREASASEVLEACRFAHVDEFAENLPAKYDSVVGERGVMLSGGQRQRIAIARALLADPRILILDEPTFGLDAHSEELVYEALSRLMRGRTTFIIAHRISRIRRSDQILVVENGEIAERGTHDELIRAGRIYQSLAMKSAETPGLHPSATVEAATRAWANPV